MFFLLDVFSMYANLHLFVCGMADGAVVCTSAVDAALGLAPMWGEVSWPAVTRTPLSRRAGAESAARFFFLKWKEAVLFVPNQCLTTTCTSPSKSGILSPSGQYPPSGARHRLPKVPGHRCQFCLTRLPLLPQC